ncbi:MULTISPECIES: hypothetical protein [unclassified Salinibacterium]|uniref:hypothetical protein n=1 Tax=Salinibacterium sp. GXW1014 TaxID=3377838 RepID=UPI0019FB20BC|nr:hypothetical protein [Salinibacterium sp.]MBF0673550.1 antitoxin [Salinibacterium sp.]
MRTTLSIDDALLTRAKRRAAQRGQTLGQYVEEAVRRDLVSVEQPSPAPTLPTFTRGTGLRRGLNPSSNRALYDALDASGDTA